MSRARESERRSETHLLITHDRVYDTLVCIRAESKSFELGEVKGKKEKKVNPTLSLALHSNRPTSADTLE